MMLLTYMACGEMSASVGGLVIYMEFAIINKQHDNKCLNINDIFYADR